MKVHFLGTTGYHPNNRRHTACLMVPELGVIFDAGTGIFRARDLIQTEVLDIYMSHVHLDHSVGLTFLLDVLYERNVNTVRVHMAEEKIGAIKENLYHRLLFPVEPDYEFVPIAEDSTLESEMGYSIRPFALEHPGGSHGFLLHHQGKSLAYVTDTTAEVDADYVEKIRDVDLLIHECYFKDGTEEYAKLTGHSCLTPVAEVAKKVNAGRLVLVHINPLDESDHPLDLDSVRSIFENIEVAEDHLVVEV